MKAHIISMAQSFVSAFLLGACVYITQTGSVSGIQWTSSFWIAVAFAGVRQVVKVLWVNNLPPAIGGKAA